ncbi:cupin domain-containing protein [Peribacillus sp. AS_2]|uniref:cupin domain-containing protein n=1 Tax=Peribacillus sp. AS_2 TaxID=2996755 RepID=UPI0022A72BB6|nr:cupin domain-containing protein [Peribacillus sp. AS_2]MCZ0874951.1 cupin domain-containing protein [Peribacillus sp. AS_2]
MSNQTTDIITYSNFLKNSRKPMIRACSWKWKDIYPLLKESVSEDFLEAGRGTLSLVHKDTGDAYGTSSTMNVVVQTFKPGEHNKAHRHTNVALNLVFQGKGFSIVDGEKIEWEKGDLFLAPPWSSHEHCNTSKTEDAILFTFQDVPVLASMGTWFLEEPVGTQPRHIVKQDTQTEKK